MRENVITTSTGEIETISVDLGDASDLASFNPLYIDNNLVLIHRSDEFWIQKWGNACSKVVTLIHNRFNNNLPIRWYHKKIFNFCYEQYDSYGDYYRVIDNSYGTSEFDTIYEVE